MHCGLDWSITNIEKKPHTQKKKFRKEKEEKTEKKEVEEESRKKKRRSGESGHRSRYLSHAKRALYHVS